MRKPVLLTLFLLILTPAGIVKGSLAQATACTSETLCGPRCLLAVCQRYNVEANLEELASACGIGGESDAKGTSMFALASAAKAKGLETSAMKIGLDELAALRCPAIAHLWSSHFLVVESGGDGKLLVTDPPGEPRSMTKEEFQPHYSGFALLISKNKADFPEPKPEGSDMRLSEYYWDFGSIEQGKKVEHALKLKNAGVTELAVSLVDVTCTCTSAIISESKVYPAGEAELKVVFDSTGRQGPQMEIVMIHSNDPITPVAQLRVTGLVTTDTVRYSPRLVQFGKLRKASKESREVFIPPTDTRPVEVVEASCDIPHLTASVSESKNEQRPGSLVTIALDPGAPVGELRGMLIVKTNHPKQPEIEIPISGMIAGDIEVFPDTLFLGMVKKGKSVEKTVKVTTAGNEPLKIEKIDNPLEHLSVKLIPNAEGKEYSLTATLSDSIAPGYIKGDIILHTNNTDQPEIKVPALGLVEE